MVNHRILYFSGGVLFLVVAVLGGSWWEFSIGRQEGPLFYLGISPFGVDVRLFGSSLLQAPPVLNALFITVRLLAIFGSATIIIWALIPQRPWSRRLLNLRAFTMSLGFLAMILVVTTILSKYVSNVVPIVSQAAPELAETLMPYYSKGVTIYLRPIFQVEGSVNVPSSSSFTIQLWLALLSGILCLAGWIIKRTHDRQVRQVGAVEPKAVAAPPPP